jgi:hypothetical protein
LQASLGVLQMQNVAGIGNSVKDASSDHIMYMFPVV